MAHLLTLLLLFAVPAAAALNPLTRVLTDPDRLIEIKSQAEAGDTKAQISYGDHLNSAMKHAAAEHWYRLAAMKGDPTALCSLGELYHSSKGFGTNQVKANVAAALELHQLAALQGHQRAHRHLAYAYMDGKGLAKDPVRAYRHFKLTGKDAMAEQYMKRLILEMSQAQIAEAEAQAEAFKPVPFKTAFETLALDSLKLEGITGPGNQRYALINGKPCNPSNPLKTTFASLPATFTCTALDQTSITLTIGSSSRTYTLNR